MSVFKPVVLQFAGVDYTVAPHEVLPLIAQIESVITLGDLANGKRLPNAKIAMAYGLALRYAGAHIIDDDIYKSLFAPGAADKMSEALGGLLVLMIPPDSLTQKFPAGDHEKKSLPQKAKAVRKTKTKRKFR